jgi:hypothetical protein
MALTLDPILAAAQDSQFRRPIVELITGKISEDIPFLGNRLTSSSVDESKPNEFVHSTGRLEAIYRTSGHLYLVYTDTARTTFSYVDLPLGAYNTPVEATVCELTSGDIGIVFITSTQLVRMVVSPTGEVVSSVSLVATFTSGTVTSPFVIRLAAGGYLLVYAFNDSGNFEIDKRTSSDFLTWFSATDITPSGLLGTNWKERPSLLQITTGQIWLWFDYLDGISGDAELVNVYYSTSDDGGGNWSSAAKFTNYAQYGTAGKHPIALQNLANTMLLMYYEQVNAFHVDSSFEGFCYITGRSNSAAVSQLTLDSANRKLYCVCSQGGMGALMALICVFRLDLDTMTIDACWNDISVPAFNTLFQDEFSGIRWDSYRGDQHLIPVAHDLALALLDGDADTITDFIFKDYPEYGLEQNVEWTDFGEGQQGIIMCAQADHSAQRLYVLLACGNYTQHGIIAGYFDLTEGGGTKTFHEIVRDPLTLSDAAGLGSDEFATFTVYTSEDLILITTQGSAGQQGWTRLYLLSTGALFKHYSYALTPGYPYWGIRKGVYAGGKICGGFPYEPLYGEEDKRGLAYIDTSTDVVAYFRPPWATLNEYGIRAMAVTDDDRLIIVCYGYGIGVFNLASQTWDPTLFNNDSLPGMDPDESNPYWYYPILYDPAANMIYTGRIHYVAWKGLIGFSTDGALTQTKYQEGTFTTSWAWSAVETLIQGLRDYDAVGAYGANSLYVFWTRTDPDDETTKIMWDREGNILNLEDYISRNQEIEIDWNIDGPPNRLTFGVTDGYLFDPHNTASLYSGFLKKARKITIREGDRVGGVNYWQKQGTFYVTEFALSYERGKYPEAKIVADDRRCFWEHKQILASDYYTTYPESLLQDILVNTLGMAVGDVDLPTFDNREVIYAQWVETMAKNIIDQVCQRFGYFPKMTVDGKFSAGRISDSNTVFHIYPDATRLINFTPDDKYSNFTNKIIVTGTERNYIEVIFDEERVGQLSGTIGWWGCKQTHDVYYSLDHSRRCRGPRLVVLESSSSVGFQLQGQIHESLSYVDPNETYCTITVTAPNLISQAIAFIAVIVANLYVGDAVAKWWTRPVGTLMQMVALTGLNMTLAAIGNFQYEVWARPIGVQRRSIQNDDNHGNDLDHQAEIGDEIVNISEEPLAGTVAELNTVADQQILVEKLQRRRVALTKTAHLQDEAGDTIRITHPHNGQNMDIFITRLTRTMKIAKKGKRDGYFRDSIEGWIL